jgi:hypothetical protein
MAAADDLAADVPAVIALDVRHQPAPSDYFSRHQSLHGISKLLIVNGEHRQRSAGVQRFGPENARNKDKP